MTGITHGRNGLADLGWRVIDARRIRGCWWIPIVLLFPALGLSAAVFTLVIGASTEPLDLAGALAKVSQPVNFAVFAFFILVVGPLPEEIGWRGYLLDRLQARWSAVSSSLFIGAVWWLWHMPLFALPGYFDAFRRASPAPLDFLFALLPSAILYTWIYNNTGRSVLAVVLFHFMENFSGEFLGMAESVDPYRLALAAALAVVVTVTWGPKKLRRTPRMEPPVY
jgi:membrane protease YdiL (CAAX protease family)